MTNAPRQLPARVVVHNDFCPVCTKALGSSGFVGVRVTRGPNSVHASRALSFKVHHDCASQAVRPGHMRLDAGIAAALRALEVEMPNDRLPVDETFQLQKFFASAADESPLDASPQST